MLEQYLVEHCSPTLAGLKTANLFSVRFIDEEELNQHMKQCEKKFQNKGVSLILLKKRADTALIYVCRREKLQKDLQKNGVKEFLKKFKKCTRIYTKLWRQGTSVEKLTVAA